MIALTLAQLSAIVGGTIAGDPSVTVTAPAVMDSRKVEAGGIFVAFAGEHADGHDFVEQAANGGAVAVLGSRPTSLPTVVVEDATAALQALATHVVGELRSGLTVLAVTGSSGKTSTKDMLASMLASVAPTVATLGNLNNSLGVPLTMTRATVDTRFLALEMGASHVGEIARLTALVAPDISIVLNVGQAHVGEFGSRDAIARTKGELVAGLAPGGTAVLNIDDPRVLAMRERTDGPVITFGIAEEADVRLVDVELDRFGRPSFTLHTADGSARVTLPLVGAHLAHNAAAATAAALAAGIPLDLAVAALSTATLTKWRMSLHSLAGDVTLLDDSYNANPDSARAGLDALATIEGARHIAVLGVMAELGDESVSEHRIVGEYAAARADVVVALGPFADALAEAAGDRAVILESNTAAIEWLRANLTAGDVVLLKGSRSAHLDEVGAAFL